MHINRGRTIAKCLSDRTDYALNLDKTDGGEYVSAYACDPKTADMEFLLSKRQYRQFTGRTQQNDVIAYQIRQSFKPGEVTPELANKIGDSPKESTLLSLPPTQIRRIFIIILFGTPLLSTARANSAIFTEADRQCESSAI